MEITTLRDLFIHEVQDLYDGEMQIIQAMPKVIQMTSNDELRSLFKAHLEETKHQAKKLEKLCQELNFSAEGKSCFGMEGILEEGIELMQETAPSPVLDAGLIAAAQRVEHYEIAGYGTAATYAETLGYYHAKEILGEILEEEQTSDEKLTDLALHIVNQQALSRSSLS